MPMLLSEVQAEVQSWANSLNGRYLDFDGGYGAQCVDPALHYGATVHGYERIRGHGAFLAGNYITTYGWGDISAKRMQPGDMVSLNWGGYYGHVLILLAKLSDGRWRILDQNSRGTGDNPSGPCEIRTVSLSSGVLRVARPPRYMGATASAPSPSPTPTPEPEPKPVLTSAQILSGKGNMSSDLVLFNADALVRAAKRAGVPLHLAAALIRQESSGKNVYGNDWGGIYGTDENTPASYNKTVTDANYRTFLSQLLRSDGTWTGRTSNGVGPAQITYWALHRDARNEGLNLADPEDNIFFGLRLFAQYLGGDYSESSVKLAATRYNAGPSATTTNDYGNKVWEWAVRYKSALAGASDTGGTTPTPTPTPAPEPTIPPLPGLEVTEDPGPLPDLDVERVSVTLPEPPKAESVPARPPNPLRVRQAGVSELRTRIWFREQWWSPIEMDINRELAIPGSDQSPLGAPPTEATGTLLLARPVRLSKKGWDAYASNPPTPGEPLSVHVSDDGWETSTTVLVGQVDDSGGTILDAGVHMGIVDLTDRLRATISHPPLNFRQPSPTNGLPYMQIGLHPAYYANLAARKAGFYATPPMVGGTTMVSAPMVGSMWPERGTLTRSRLLNARGRTAWEPTDAPEYRRTWWGLSVHNVFAVYRPQKVQSWAGRMTTAHGVRALVGPVTSTISAVELWWDRVSITTMVSTKGVIVETQGGWNADGTRKKLFERIRPLTAEQIANGFELKVWLLPDGVITISVDGEKSVHTALPWWPRESRDEDMSDVRILAPAKGAPLGGVQVVGDPTEGSFGPWERTFLLDADPKGMIWGGPALERKPAIDLLREMAEGELSSMWISEDGRLNYVAREQMDARPVTRHITLDDATAAGWTAGRESVVAAVQVNRQQPSLYQTRMNSRAWTQVWEGPRDTLEPGGKWEQIIRSPDNEDWFHVDTSFEEVTASAVANVNRGIGSWVGGTVLKETDDGGTEELPAPRSWFYGDADRVTHRAWKVWFGYTPPSGVDSELSLSNPDLPGLAKRRQGNGPILRARGLQTWEDMEPVVEGASSSMPSYAVHEHNGGWFIQSASAARRVAKRLALMLSQPIPSWGDVEMLVPDLSIRLGDTVVTTFPGVPAKQRVCGIRLHMGEGTGLTQTLTTRQLHP